MPVRSERERKIREERASVYNGMTAVLEKLDAGTELTRQDREHFDKSEARLKVLDGDLDRVLISAKREHGGASSMETRMTGQPVAEIQGVPNEVLRPGQSMTEWVRRAAENGVTVQSDGEPAKRVEYRDAGFMNEAWGQRLGFARPGAELRALGEDTTGSGLAINPQSWTSSFIDYLYPMTVLGRAGISRVPMSTEIVNKPQFTDPVQVAWIAENSTIGIDANPAFSTLAFNAQGGFKDITLYSIELAQDAYVSGGLPDLLAQSAARSYALSVDVAGLQGILGNSAGNPGLVNETGFNTRAYTGYSSGNVTMSDTTELSVVKELIAAANVDLDDPAVGGAIISNPQVKGTMARLKASTYAKFWDWTTDTAALAQRWYTSANANILPATETDGTTPALTGGTGSSFYMGPWAFQMLGVHLQLSSRPLAERYVDYGQLGLFSMMRFSIRTGHPEAFYRTTSIATS